MDKDKFKRQIESIWKHRDTDEQKRLLKFGIAKTMRLTLTYPKLAQEYYDSLCKVIPDNERITVSNYHHNLTSDAEGEEMLMVSRKDIVELYQEVNKTISQCKGTGLAMQSIGIKNVLWSFFGSKCLPDEPTIANNATVEEPKPAEPKFTKGDMVHCKSFGYEGDYKVLEYTGGPRNCYDCIDKYGAYYRFYESDLEPYTEPKKEESEHLQAESVETLRIASEESHLRNLSQESENCDKHGDNILKDSFRAHNRLHIAAMAMQGILSNTDLFKNVLETGIETLGDDEKVSFRAVAKASLIFADGLISESEKGGTK